MANIEVEVQVQYNSKYINLVLYLTFYENDCQGSSDSMPTHNNIVETMERFHSRDLNHFEPSMHLR